MAIEKPSFDVISSANDVEIRLYHPALLAHTQVSGDFNYSSLTKGCDSRIRLAEGRSSLLLAGSTGTLKGSQFR